MVRAFSVVVIPAAGTRFAVFLKKKTARAQTIPASGLNGFCIDSINQI